MHSTRLIHLLMAALSVTAVTGVAWLDKEHTGLDRYEVKRQDDIISIGHGGSDSDSSANPTPSDEDDSSSTSAPPDTSTPPPPTSTDESTSTSPTSDPPTQTTSDNPPTSTRDSTPPPTTTRPSSTPTSSPSSTPTETSSDDTTAPPATTAPPTTSTLITVITTTDSAGQTVVTSSSSTIVSTPTPIGDQNGDNPSSMSKETQNTIIGVCVGVGGAIVLAAAGVLFWRLRSKRRNHEENEELVSYGDGFGGPGTAEKTEPSGTTASRSPFQSTLESYHAPTQTNAASNF